jgi:hypothetical protein
MKIVFNYINLSESTPLSFRHAYVTRTRIYRHLWRHKILREHYSHLFQRQNWMGLMNVHSKKFCINPILDIMHRTGLQGENIMLQPYVFPFYCNNNVLRRRILLIYYLL